MVWKTESDAPKVSIVFVNWNGKKYTFDLIDSLKKISYKNYDIIVVDNGSSDGTQAGFKKKYPKDATLIENRRNLGLAEGTNVGVREALKRGSKYVLVMNNDMIVKEDFLDILVNSMEKNPEVAVAGPKIYYMEPSNMIWSAGCDYHLYGYKSRQQGKIDAGFNEKERYVDAIDCVLMLRSSVLREIGLLESKYFIIHELVEWCLRAKNKGYRSLYVPSSVVWHKVSASLELNKKEDEISTYYNIRNWLFLIKKSKSFVYYLGILFLQSTLFASYRFMRYLKNKSGGLIKTYYVAIWHSLINKAPLELYPYEKK